MPPSLAHIAEAVIGGMLIGLLLDSLMIGIATVQLYTYVCGCKADTTIVKLLVGFCSILVTAALPFNVCAVYQSAVTGFGGPGQLIQTKTSLTASLLITVLPAKLIQVFFAWRVWRLMDRLWVFIAVVVLAPAQAGITISGMTVGIRSPDISKVNVVKPYMIAWFSAALTADLLISCNLVWFFLTKRTGFKDTDDLLKRLARVTIGSGTAVTTWTLASTCAFLLIESNTFLVFMLSTPALYLITLLFSLNSRYSDEHSGELVWTDDSSPDNGSVHRQSSTPVQPDTRARVGSATEAHELEEYARQEARWDVSQLVARNLGTR